MPRRRRYRADGTPAPRARRTPKPKPTRQELEQLDRLTDSLPDHLRAYRDREILSPTRRYRLEEALQRRTRSLVVVLHGVHDPHNQAAVMRSCEAFGLQEIHIADDPSAPLRPSSRVTQNAHRWLDVERHPDFTSAAENLRQRGFELWTAIPTPTSRSLYEMDFTRPIALVFGNESRGLPAEIADRCDGEFVIPLVGFTQSLNISAAAAIAFSWAVETRRRQWGRSGDLGDDELAALREHFYRQAAGFPLD